MANANDTALAAALAEIASLKAQVARKSPNGGKLTCKVSLKGAISVYGLGRWPVTLYREQFDRLLAAAPEIKAFIAANEKALSVKGEERPQVEAVAK